MIPLITAVAPNGARRTKADHPALPVTASEIADAASACLEAGACMIHMHVRDAQGGHTLDPGIFSEAIEAVRKAVGMGMIIQVSSEAVGIYTPQDQMAAVRAIRPEAVSLALGEIMPDNHHQAEAVDFLQWLERERVMVQYILYTPSELARFSGLHRRGVIPGANPSVLLVLGRYGQAPAEPSDLLPFIGEETESMNWMVCAFGDREADCVHEAVVKGGHARIGFENNYLLSGGGRAPDNAALVTQLGISAASAGRPLADAHTARAMMGAG